MKVAAAIVVALIVGVFVGAVLYDRYITSRMLRGMGWGG